MTVRLAALLSVLPLAGERAHGQTWLYSGTDYGTGVNWSTGVTPGAGQTATFNQDIMNQPVIGGNFTIGTVNMNAGSLTINATRTLTVQSAYNLTDASILGSGALSLGAGSLLRAEGSSAVTIAPVISGPGAILITGDNVAVTGSNTFTGTTTIDPGGQLSLGTGGTTGTLGTGATTNNGTLVFNRSNAFTVASVIAGTGSVSKIGSGTTSLTGANSYTGTTTIGAGILSVGAGGTIGQLGTGDVINNATLQINRSDATFTLGNDISGSGALTKTAAGTGTTLILTGSNTYGGTTTITEGTLQIGTGGTTGSLGSGTVVTTGGTLAFNRSDALTLASAISGTGSVNQIGSGTTSLTGTNTYSGITTISAGILQIGDGGMGGTLGTGIITTATGGTLAFNRSDDIMVANAITGTGAVSKLAANTLILTGTNSYSGGTTISAGILQLGDGGITGSIAGDVTNNAALAFNGSNAFTLSGAISGNGAVDQIGTGTTILTGANSYTGATNVSAGTLLINGDQSASTGLTTVLSGATLGGTGIIGGDVAAAIGATVAPGESPGTLTIQGGLMLSADSILEFEFGEANAIGGALNDFLEVGGDLVLDGTLNVSVTSGGGFDGGIYRVINYGGALTDNRLAIDTAPPGSDVFVQTSTPNQVNLVNTAGLTLNFWDGAAGPKFNGVVNGGNGIWQNGNDNWADASGVVNAPYSDGSFAVFMAAPGTVTIHNDLGAVTGSGMQFASDGYRIAGDVLTLMGAQSVVRVGDGSVPGAGYTATIGSSLTGSSQLVKTDLGTLVLTGTNGYTGGTAINGGTLQISSDANLGDAAGGLSFSGGTLHSTADLASTRAVDLVGDGVFRTETFTTFTLGGTVSGDGSLAKDGSGTLIFAADNSYNGTTTISAGILSIGAGGTTGTLGIGDVVNNAALQINRSDETFTLANGISGTGALTKTTAGTSTTLILIGANSYGGTTTISAGTLQIGDGGTSGSLGTGTVVTTGGTLAFNRSDDIMVANAITGTGALSKLAANTLILAGPNSYSGTTTISDGTLQVGDGGTGGTLGTGTVITTGGTLAFNRSDDIMVANAITGTGAVSKLAANTLILTGTNTYSGGTTISAGILQVGESGITGSIAGDVTNNATLVFNGSNAATLSGIISGSGAVNQIGAGATVLTGANRYTGATNVRAGTLLINGDQSAATGLTNVLSGGTLGGSGIIGGDVTVDVGATVAPGESPGTLTINGDYIGLGGMLQVEVQLTGGASPSDQLIVGGSTSGHTTLSLVNFTGSRGPRPNGIKIIDVNGASDGQFTLDGDYAFRGHEAVIAGAFAYTLEKNGVSTATDGDWYLRSSLKDAVEETVDLDIPLYQPGVPVYEAYSEALLTINALSNWRERIGRRHWTPTKPGTGIWGRAEGVRHRLNANVSASLTNTNTEIISLQAGLDHLLVDSSRGALIGGITGHYRQGRTNVSSVFGNGKIDINGYGMGATLSWYGSRDFYVDAQAEISWYDADLRSRTLGVLVDGSDGKGRAFSIEAGKHLRVGGLTISPQAQLVYSKVDFDRFIDPHDAIVAIEKGESLEGRLGLSFDRSIKQNNVTRGSIYGLVNVNYEMLDGTRADVSGTGIDRRNDRLWGELGVGGIFSLGPVTLSGEISMKTSLRELGDSYSVKGQAGIRVRF